MKLMEVPGFILEESAVSVVFVGSFNPSMMHPEVFVKSGLIRAERTEMSVRYVTPEIANFSVSNITVECIENRLVFLTIDPRMYSPLFDLAIGLIGIMPLTLLSAVGLNIETHHRAPNKNDWHKVGNELAPKQIWSQILDSPGMKELNIVGKCEATSSNETNIRVEPSPRFDPGLSIRVNQHYQLADNSSPMVSVELADKLVAILRGEWPACQAYHKKVVHSVITGALKA